MAVFSRKDRSPELGFGKKAYSSSVRFINRDGSVNIRRKGSRWLENIDIYHWLINTSVTKLGTMIICTYIFINLVFGTVYFAIGPQNFGGLDTGSKLDSFIDLFFFSAQTLTTVGYGHVYPLSHWVSFVSAIESMIGLLGFAIATGLLYGRFSRPKADLEYSKHMLISPYEGMTGLMFRIGNKKQYELIESEANITISYFDPATNKREFDQLKLEVNRINYLALSWTIVHPIDDESPIKGWTLQDFIERDAEVMCLIKAINDTFSQTVYSRNSYKPEDIIDNAKFVPVKQEPDKRGRITIKVADVHDFHKVESN
jgi:inward rectifier potassium channel